MVGNTSDNYLMTRLDKVHDTLIANLLHISFLLPSICLLHSNERLCERHGPEPAVKEEEAFIWVDPQEGGDVNVVGQGGRQTHHSNHLLTVLHLAQSSGNQGLKDRASIPV